MTGGRRVGIATVVSALCLTAPVAAFALTTHQATESEVGPDDFVTATAQCGNGERVVSGGFRMPENAYAQTSVAEGNGAWQIKGSSLLGGDATAFAYCSSRIDIVTKTKAKQVAGSGDSGDRVNVTASCPRGTAVAGGGWVAVPEENLSFNIFDARRVGTRGWRVSAFDETGDGGKLKAIAHCLEKGTVKVRTAKSTGIPEETAGAKSVRCHRGEQLLGGGFKSTPRPDYENNDGPDFYFSENRRTGPRSWKASAHNYSDVSGKIIVSAYCLT